MIGEKHLSMLLKVCMVTGATSGIGKQTALELAAMGATVILVGRNHQKCMRTSEMINAKVPTADVDFIVADLSSQEQVQDLAAEFRRRYNRLDVLVNNAGGVFLRRQTSVDGIEMTFALNHLNYFLLTNLLLDILRTSAPSRVVNVASGAHRNSPLDFDDLQAEKNYVFRNAYGQSKFANIIFTYELARKLEGTGVIANVLHPGLVATNIGRDNGILAKLVQPLIFRRGLPVEEGARTVVYLASSAEVEGVTGKYFFKERETKSDPATYREEDWRRLWEISAQMTGLVGGMDSLSGSR